VKTEIVQATQELIDAMKGKLRKVDELEVRATSGKSADEALQYGFDKSDLCWILLADNRPVAAFGVCPMSTLGLAGIPWLLATEDLPKFTKEVVRLSKPYIMKMLEKYATITNWSDERNTIARRWLKWCGFTFDTGPSEYGIERRKFTQFFAERGSYV